MSLTGTASLKTYNLPPQPRLPTEHLRDGWRSAAIEAVAMVAAVAASFLVWDKSKGTSAND